ncbi:family 43 glycosyl hydrolase [Elsinoe ampelina]|uniref:Family 43 glycosyl hydrolase n=1 Tax=Elsinoe ampelina TaxID=302913 RepID=A0A6A6GK55_9PEZI|nr:family 43 glycosyl hydrolase [Elsinoe ampelina]
MFSLELSFIGSFAYTNPVLWEDLPDIDVIRVNDTYYYSASTFHHSPGGPLLASKDLVNWEYIAHSVPTLDFGSKYSMENGTAYVNGIWASSTGYRTSTGLFYWVGCIDFARTYIYTAPNAEGPWTRLSEIGTCYYDAGLLIDDNDTMYVAYGNTQLSVAELSTDGKEVKQQQVFQTPADIGTVEGSRFYKIENYYYIFVTRPANAQYILRSDNPWGPYEFKDVVVNVPSPMPSSGWPHQGGLVDTPDGQWFYMAFIDSYPMGRTPVLAPVIFEDGWPTVQLVNGAWGKAYTNPLPLVPVAPHTGIDTFTGSSLSQQWEWSHNPDTTAFTTGNGLTLSTVTVTDDYYKARNTLTRRVIGPKSRATIQLNATNMVIGDRAGLGVVRDCSALLQVQKTPSGFEIGMVNGLNLTTNTWETQSNGTVVETRSLAGPEVWLRATVDVTPGAAGVAQMEYSAGGEAFEALGEDLVLQPDWPYFLGYRFGLFNFASDTLGGSVNVGRFELEVVE